MEEEKEINRKAVLMMCGIFIMGTLFGMIIALYLIK